MTNEKNLIKIDVGTVGVFPAIVDYDFIKMRPRGGSCRADFFCSGKLCSTLDEVSVQSCVFMKKNDIFFNKGFFLLDFSRIEKDAANIADMIMKMGEGRIYIENSTKYSPNRLIELLTGIKVILLDFSCRQ